MATHAPLVWDKTGEHLYETGTKKGVLFPMDESGKYPKGVAWNGLTAVNESPSGAEANPLYADDIKYLNLLSTEEYAATVEAYTYPDEWAECDGSAEIAPGVSIGQQKRKSFGLSWVTAIGNDVDGVDFGYKIHLLYGGLAAPSEKAYATQNESPEAITFSWEISTVPVSVEGFKPTASITIDSTKVDRDKLAAFEKVLYGSTEADARLPLPDEVAKLLTPSETARVSVTAATGEKQQYGKKASELQENIEINDTRRTISGKLKYVKDFEQFSSVDTEQKGNFLWLDFGTLEGATIKTKVINGVGQELKQVDDGFCIYRLTNPDTQKIHIEISKGEDTTIKEYSLTGLTLDPSDEEE